MGSIAKKILEEVNSAHDDDLDDLVGLLDRAGHRPSCEPGSCRCGYGEFWDIALDYRLSVSRRRERIELDIRGAAQNAGRIFGHADDCDYDRCSCGAGELAEQYSLDVRGAHIALHCNKCLRSYCTEPGETLLSGDECPSEEGDKCSGSLVPVRLSLFDKVPGVPF